METSGENERGFSQDGLAPERGTALQHIASQGNLCIVDDSRHCIHHDTFTELDTLLYNLTYQSFF